MEKKASEQAAKKRDRGAPAAKNVIIQIQADRANLKRTMATVSECNNGCCYTSGCTALSTSALTIQITIGYSETMGTLGRVAPMCVSTKDLSVLLSGRAGTRSSWEAAYQLDVQIPEAHFTTTLWIGPSNYWPFWGGSWIDEDLSSSVNTESNRHLHSYCGGVLQD